MLLSITYNKKATQIEVPQNISIKEIKQTISKSFDIPKEKIKLFFQIPRSNQDSSINELKINNGSELLVMIDDESSEVEQIEESVKDISLINEESKTDNNYTRPDHPPPGLQTTATNPSSSIEEPPSYEEIASPSIANLSIPNNDPSSLVLKIWYKWKIHTFKYPLTNSLESMRIDILRELSPDKKNYQFIDPVSGEIWDNKSVNDWKEHSIVWLLYDFSVQLHSTNPQHIKLFLTIKDENNNKKYEEIYLPDIYTTVGKLKIELLKLYGFPVIDQRFAIKSWRKYYSIDDNRNTLTEAGINPAETIYVFVSNNNSPIKYSETRVTLKINFYQRGEIIFKEFSSYETLKSVVDFCKRTQGPNVMVLYLGKMLELEENQNAKLYEVNLLGNADIYCAIKGKIFDHVWP